MKVKSLKVFLLKTTEDLYFIGYAYKLAKTLLEKWFY